MKLIKTILKWALPSAKIAYKLMAVSAEAFCRHSFGRRYASSLLASFFFCFVTMGFLQLAAPDHSSPAIELYLLCFFILILYHFGRMWRPYCNVHSYANGLPWKFWERFGLNQKVVQMLIDPAVHILISFLIFPLSAVLSCWLMTAGICLFIKEFLIFWQEHNRILDSADARIEGERISSGVRHYTAPQSGGQQRLTPVSAVEQAQQPRSSIHQIYSRLDPALQQLVSTPQQNRPTPPPASRHANRRGPRQYHAGPLGMLPRITSKRPRLP